jgi:putative N6-adenine-specific DNA methylase
MRQYFATVARGLENLAAEELTQLGGKAVEPGFCGVAFRGDQELMYRVNLWSRLAFRILVKVGEYPAQDADALYRSIQRVNWDDRIPPEKTLAVDVTGKNQHLNHSHFTAFTG